MKLSVTMISFEDYASAGKMSVEEFIHLCSGYGIDAVDILEYFWRDKEKEVREIPSILKKEGLELGAFCIGNSFTVPPEKRPAVIDYVKQGIDTAVKLGAKRLRIFGGSAVSEGVKEEDKIGAVIEGIKKCIDYAAENKIILVLENHGGVPLTSGEMLQVIHGINSPYLKVNFDIGNFLSYRDEDPLHAAQELYPYVDFIHAKDLVKAADGPEKYISCVTGEGVVPVRECLRFFKQKGYDGYVSLEYEAWKSVDSKQGVKKSLDYLKKILKEI